MDETTDILLKYRTASGYAKEDLLAALMERCRSGVLSYILNRANSWHFPQKDMNDVESIFWNDAFTPALQSYDETGPATFKTYLTKCGYKRLVSFLRSEKAKGRFKTISLDGLVEDFDDENDRRPEILDTNATDLDRNTAKEAAEAFRSICRSQANSVQEQKDYAVLALKVESFDSEGDDGGYPYTVFDKALYLRIMARVDKGDYPSDIVPQEPIGPTIDLAPLRLVALRTALWRANHWNRWELRTAGQISR